ncbi:hypothetical protein VNO78_25910 [Psophocarpus tetragonolobus]|uniref:Uncharacterized protein n=1 Tax=Psophocarpus tetragonolobus TaxID=3891 RepID=A0AAN9XFV4_PSOTE
MWDNCDPKTEVRPKDGARVSRTLPTRTPHTIILIGGGSTLLEELIFLSAMKEAQAKSNQLAVILCTMEDRRRDLLKDARQLSKVERYVAEKAEVENAKNALAREWKKDDEVKEKMVDLVKEKEKLGGK